ncbi:MAG: hypothetical protein ABIS67_14815 [Candidatus Eisenbacteria bacterium]
MNVVIYPILFIVGAAALALWMRHAGKDESVSSDGERRPDDPEGRADVGDGSYADDGSEFDDDFDADSDAGPTGESMTPDARVPVTSEGIALVAAGAQVRLVDLATPEEMPGWLESGIRASSVPYSEVARAYSRTMVEGRGHFGGSSLHNGDFTAARIRREAGGGWNLETLGRDGDFGFMPFDTEKGAREAMELIEAAGIVQRTLDEDDQPVPSSDEDFEEARRRYEETERDLAITPDDDEPPRPGDWSSRR